MKIKYEPAIEYTAQTPEYFFAYDEDADVGLEVYDTHMRWVTYNHASAKYDARQFMVKNCHSSIKPEVYINLIEAYKNRK